MTIQIMKTILNMIDLRIMFHHPAIRAQNLHFSFATHEVVRGIDLDVPWGAVTAIVGSNGAGKSTLLELLAGVRTPSPGRVEIAGSVALVVQRPAAPSSLPLTVADAVAIGASGPLRRRLPRREKPRVVCDALERVGLAELRAQPFDGLSGGQRQRVLIAQGIVGGAQILLLDEPAAGLDSVSRTATRSILADEAARGTAVVCVTHDPEDLIAADRCFTVDAGRLANGATAARS